MLISTLRAREIMNATVIKSTMTPNASATQILKTSEFTHGILEGKRRNCKIIKHRKRKTKTFFNQLHEQTYEQCDAISVPRVDKFEGRKYDLEELSTMCIGPNTSASLKQRILRQQQCYFYTGFNNIRSLYLFAQVLPPK